MNKVLILDKDRLVARNISLALTSVGLKTFIATSEFAANQLCRENEFKIIVSDSRFSEAETINFLKTLINKTESFFFLLDGSNENLLWDGVAESFGREYYAFNKPLDMLLLINKAESALRLSHNQPEPQRGEEAKTPSWKKKVFYNALSSQWNPERGIRWHDDINISEDLCQAMAVILSPIIMGEYSAFNEIPKRIIAFPDYEIKQCMASQLIDETRHAEAFELYLARIKGYKSYRKGLRNIYSLRFFNGMKKLKGEDEWIAGLYVTEILAHILLSEYKKASNCALTSHLFSMIIADEGRHISFGNSYLKSIFKNATKNDKKFLLSITDETLALTEGMLYSFSAAYKSFNLCPETLLAKIHNEVRGKIIGSLYEGENCISQNLIV